MPFLTKKKYLLAERVFRTVKYQDGLVRLAQHYYDLQHYFHAAELFRLGKSLKGEYHCYLKLGLIADLPDFQKKISKQSADEIVNQRLARVIQAMLAKYPD